MLGRVPPSPIPSGQDRAGPGPGCVFDRVFRIRLLFGMK